MYEAILFIDFDGTITSEDTLEGALESVVPRELIDEKTKEMLAGRKTLSQVVREGFATIPSEKFPVMMKYLEAVPLRGGFPELLDAAERMGIPVVVISGGLRPMIEAKIGAYRDRLLGMHYVELDLSGPYMELVSDYDDGTELLAKTKIMEQYQYKRALSIGDSYTDVNMAAGSDVVFARDRLANIMEQKHMPYVPFEDFFDVVRWLEHQADVFAISSSK